MNLNYSDEQNMLREQVLKFCETNYDFIDREKILDSDSGYSEDNWKQFAELGWLAVPFKEDNGGFNFGPIELTVLFEEFGKALVVEPYLSSVVRSGTILEGSNHPAKASIIEKIISNTPTLLEINNSIDFNEGYAISKKKDKFKLHIAFRIDGNQKLGMGHVYRVMNISKQLQKNHSLLFITKTPIASKMLSSFGQCVLFKKNNSKIIKKIFQMKFKKPFKLKVEKKFILSYGTNKFINLSVFWISRLFT